MFQQNDNDPDEDDDVKEENNQYRSQESTKEHSRMLEETAAYKNTIIKIIATQTALYIYTKTCTLPSSIVYRSTQYEIILFTQTHTPPVTSPVMGSTFLVMMRSVSGVVPSARSMIIGIRTGINVGGRGKLFF